MLRDRPIAVGTVRKFAWGEFSDGNYAQKSVPEPVEGAEIIFANL